jgi:hypothetical protein
VVAGIDADDRATQRREPLGKRAVAAAEIEDSLARTRRQQLDHRRAEVGDEACIGGVAIGLPVLVRCVFHAAALLQRRCRNMAWSGLARNRALQLT